jgi:uncharacterized membrane protein YebE (DUF533 family)
MDAKSLLEDLLNKGREMAAKGQAIVEDKLDIKEPGEKRDATISGLKTGAMAAGVMALLLGTKTGRNVTSSALKLGSLAAVGSIAWQAYQNWSAGNENAAKNGEPTQSVSNLLEEEQNDRSLLLLKAMIAAAKADDHVDEEEMASIQKQVTELGLTGDIAGFIQAEMASPTCLEGLASQCETPAVASEVYLVSSLMINKRSEAESAYLDALAAALKLPDSLLIELEKAKQEA